MDNRPRLFQPGTLFDSKTYDQILSSVYNQSNQLEEEEKEEQEQEQDVDNDDDNISNEELFDQRHLNNERDREIQYLTQIIRDEQPMNDNIANIIMQQLNSILETTINNIEHTQDSKLKPSSVLSTTTTTTTTTTHPYPPIDQTAYLTPHDRPYADYGHLDRQTIANEFQFNLEQPTNRQTMRLHAKSFAITSWTNVSKEIVMNEIKRDFGVVNIQYICISEEISEVNHQRHLHIQILFKEKINRRKPFLDDITQTHCNYQVTHNDCAWNEYIKKDGNYIEFGTFQSTTQRKQKQWPSSASSTSSVSCIPTSTTADNNQPLVSKVTTATTIKLQAHEKRQYEENIVKQALGLAETSVDGAMDLLRHSMPTKFLHHSSWYESGIDKITYRSLLSSLLFSCVGIYQHLIMFI
jgi:hypothetical protein